MYVIKRIDQGGGYVAPSGMPNSYTNALQNARTFGSREEAQRQCCGNEVVRSVDEELRH